MKKDGFFNAFASKVAHYGGHPAAFCLAFAAVIAWAIAGPFAGFSEVWQLTINTGTTIITFLMVFIIQNTQNRDTAAMQLKLDELIRATQGAKNSVIDFEQLPEDTLQKLQKEYAKLAKQAREEGEASRTNEEDRVGSKDKARRSRKKAGAGSARSSGSGRTKAARA